MPTDWIRRHVTPGLVTRYEQAMKKLRGEVSSAEHIVDDICNMNEQIEHIETDEQRRARALAEDEADMLYHQQNKI